MNYRRALDNSNDGHGEAAGEWAGWYGDEDEDCDMETEESQPVRYEDNGK
ncbi:MAG: hypothetical protein QOI07_943 [Verrucomicrobiota bacterium]|jgi:hypothetical protein